MPNPQSHPDKNIQVYWNASTNKPDADKVVVREKGQTPLVWTIQPGSGITSITAIDGLPNPPFSAPQSTNPQKTVWRCVDDAAFENNGVYHYCVTVIRNGESVSSDPDAENDVPPT